MSEFTYKGKDFLLDGEPFVIISGAVHYFRVPREYWRDRLLKLRECGFNTVETYTCWNLHEPREGEFHFEDMLDLGHFLDIAAEVGLKAIVRPGPYICSEWELGGLPSWLLTYTDITLRCYNERYMAKMKPYFVELCKILRPRLLKNGGNIIMLQVENEYGSYGNDKTYLRAVAEIYRENGMDCMYFTSDGPSKLMLNSGTLDEYLCVANFGSAPRNNLRVLSEFRPDQPSMCGEFWCGWFDHWYEGHHVRPVEDIINCFNEFLEDGASLNYYMWHGGTNFGFTNGANHTDTQYQPTVTSYDYNAPLSEAGDRTPLYYAIRDAIRERYGVDVPLTASETPKAAYGKVTLTERAFLLPQAEKLGKTVESAAPLFMEDLGQDFGYVLYSTDVRGPMEQYPLILEDMHDRARFYLDGNYSGYMERTRHQDTVRVGPYEKGEGVHLDILVENMGRVNYGPFLLDRKGMRGMRFIGVHQFGWKMVSLPMTDLSALTYEPVPADPTTDMPSFYRGTLTIEGTPADTFVKMNGFHKGFITVNGHNLGRYWNDTTPQRTLYVPAPWLKEGENEIIVFESDKCDTTEIEFFAEPDLGDPIQ